MLVLKKKIFPPLRQTGSTEIVLLILDKVHLSLGKYFTSLYQQLHSQPCPLMFFTFIVTT